MNAIDTDVLEYIFTPGQKCNEHDQVIIPEIRTSITVFRIGCLINSKQTHTVNDLTV